jgi:putative hydrolase of the HAD superfamily
MLRAVGFDLWETLITNTPEVSREHGRVRLEKLTRTLAERGLAPPRERIEAAYRGSWNRCQELYWSRDRDVPCRRQVEHFLEELAVETDEATLARLEEDYANVAVDILPVVVDGARDLIRELKARGLRLGLISNTGRTPGYALREILVRLGLSDSIDAMLFSNEHGHCKPQRSIFEELRRHLGVSSDELVFVGDNLYVDVHGAQRCGMRGVHFIPPSRGTAVAPHVDHGLEIVPDAVIRDLRELPAILDRL